MLNVSFTGLIMVTLFNTLLDWIFYKKCYFCSNSAKIGLMCDKCFEKMKAETSITLKKVAGIQIKGYFTYQDNIKKLIRAIKYHNKKDLAKNTAKILFEIMEKEILDDKNIEIIPVPLHDLRQKQRKYNHMEEISRELCALTGWKINNKLVKRVKDTAPQYKLSNTQRLENLKGAFKVFPKAYLGGKVFLIDDISTTGATMQEIVYELKKNNIKNVSGFVIAFPLTH